MKYTFSEAIEEIFKTGAEFVGDNFAYGVTIGNFSCQHHPEPCLAVSSDGKFWPLVITRGILTQKYTKV